MGNHLQQEEERGSSKAKTLDQCPRTDIEIGGGECFMKILTDTARDKEDWKRGNGRRLREGGFNFGHK